MVLPHRSLCIPVPRLTKVAFVDARLICWVTPCLIGLVADDCWLKGVPFEEVKTSVGLCGAFMTNRGLVMLIRLAGVCIELTDYCCSLEACLILSSSSFTF